MATAQRVSHNRYCAVLLRLRSFCAAQTFRCFAVVQAERALRPRLRRAEMIERPARVRIRRRKPCLRLRRRLLGWNVRLLTVVLPIH